MLHCIARQHGANAEHIVTLACAVPTANFSSEVPVHGKVSRAVSTTYNVEREDSLDRPRSCLVRWGRNRIGTV